jgi:hypothetical protein
MKCNDPNCHGGGWVAKCKNLLHPNSWCTWSNPVRRNHAAFQEIIFSKMPCIIFIFPYGIIWEKEKLI